jgi:polyisoprenoid-binding protein YceI
VTLNFTLTIDGDRAHASGSTQLDRSAFGVGSGEWAATTEIGADVAVKFDFSANRIKS